MGFRESLEQVCDVEGAVAASVMGYDGIAIDTLVPGGTELDFETLMVEYAGILAQVRQAADVLQTGELEELSIATERLTAHLRPINGDYFLVLAMKPEGNLGKGRYLLRVAAPRLRTEF